MPRTKRSAVSKSKPKVTASQEAILAAIDDREMFFLEQLNRKEKELHAELEEKYKQLGLMIPAKLLKRTIEEIMNGDVPYCDSSSTVLSSTVLTDISHNVTQNITRSTKMKPNVSKLKGKRSTSCDDGYTTSESTRTTHSGRSTTRQSRSKIKKASANGGSRSLTRTRDIANPYVTPLNKQPSGTNAGSITPKLKPNTAIFCMRRPKNGEIAWSNQGSPLLVNASVPDQTANINIPVGSDAIYSILPQRGPLRQSQIPDFDSETQRQLEALRDNLIRVCCIKKPMDC